MTARFRLLAGAAFVAAVSIWVGVPGDAAESAEITGVVTSASGPEEGVWVIAETDDPNGGWKGRGVWATSAAAATWHIEGGQNAKPGIIKFQVRPDPLAN